MHTVRVRVIHKAVAYRNNLPSIAELIVVDNSDVARIFAKAQHTAIFDRIEKVNINKVYNLKTK